jgi:enoyl-CoA hydratase
MYGPEQDAIIHTADGIKLVREQIDKLGLKGAIQWFNEQDV